MRACGSRVSSCTLKTSSRTTPKWTSRSPIHVMAHRIPPGTSHEIARAGCTAGIQAAKLQILSPSVLVAVSNYLQFAQDALSASECDRLGRIAFEPVGHEHVLPPRIRVRGRGRAQLVAA